VALTFDLVDLSDDELALRDEVRAFLAEELARGTFEPGLGMDAPSSPEFSHKLGERGWLGMSLPAKYGIEARSTASSSSRNSSVGALPCGITGTPIVRPRR
jgi:alkylation response protein AidB-like acyl-CoA dehydrogenase